MKFFDCNARIGLRIEATSFEQNNVPALIKEMQRLSIESALVAHYSGMESEPVLGNRLVLDETRDHEELIPAATMLPSTWGDVPRPRELADELILAGCRAVWLFPGLMNWSLSQWCSDSLFQILEQRKMPVMLTADEADFNELHGLLERYPELPVMFSEIPYRMTRQVFPLARLHPNLYLDMSPPFTINNGYEVLCSNIGASRLLFGTGFPVSEPGAAVTYLMYADISGEEKELIAYGNIEKLVKGVVS
jgi:hypothetical protein